MRRNMYLAPILLLLAALAAYTFHQHAPAPSNDTEPLSTAVVRSLQAGLERSITVYYEIIVDNKTVARGVDPVTKHWINAAISMLIPELAWMDSAGRLYTASLEDKTVWLTINDTSGREFDTELCNAHLYLPNNYDSTSYISDEKVLIGIATTDSVALDYTTNKPPIDSVITPAATYKVSENSTHIVVEYSAPIGYTGTVYGVFTVLQLRIGNCCSYNSFYGFGGIMIAADMLDTPVTVNEGEQLHVKYVIVIKKTLPLNVNGWHLIVNYLLAAKYYHSWLSIVLIDGTSVGCVDTGNDNDYHGNYDDVRDITFLIPIAGTVGVTKTTLEEVSNINDMDTVCRQSCLVVNSLAYTVTGNDTMTCGVLAISGSREFTSARTVSALALVRNVDTRDPYYYNRGAIVVGFIPLPSSVTTDMLSVGFSLGLCGS